jgi:UDP-N-acetylglucosamine diphosphorylase/glucosamine-1-phosphate N-acetyltransferase
MNFILFDDRYADHLLPLTFTRPVADIRIGILKISEKWKQQLSGDYSFYTKDYLRKKYPANYQAQSTFINGAVLPGNGLVEEILALKAGQGLVKDDKLIARSVNDSNFDLNQIEFLDGVEVFEVKSDFDLIEFPHQIFNLNGKALEDDFKLLTKDKVSEPIGSSNQVLGSNRVFLEKGAKVECAILNANSGPIYIGVDAEIMEGSIIRGPFAICEHSATKMGTKVYGPTTIGPYSKVGGELNNVVVFGYSNKAHDGFLGNAVIGEWCNIGADTNNSNLKNNYAEVKLWDYVVERFAPTGLQFAGLIMGDHSKCGINTMFNTGTVIGVFANIFGAGFPRNFIPSFAWGGAAGMKEYKLNAALYVARLVMQRRGIELDEVEKQILEHIFELTQKYRRF